ncbi:acyl-CoA reductase [Epilithonimonas lactis]|uniref:Acyl-CoA reductase n=1 Tax=Epilithonimonas lactis TaxID=421072 RepID=A0A085B950_9FLAO|nr:acyl-CoA reductase [Epilithonimonas lactis]KFC18995.1 acyl-CoA reductase [Epilithonimonas lactis]SEQ95795.1 Acyl-CoA reductase (LuxC) [Epilithonimonas lactis]
MLNENKILGLEKLGNFINEFIQKDDENYNEKEERLAYLMKRSEIENPWFTLENQRYNLKQWAGLFTKGNIENWLSKYELSNTPKRVGLILAGNIPIVGFHDIISVVLSNHIPIIKLSSKDKLMLPFLLELWKEFSNNEIEFEIVDRLENFDAVIATGSNNTARYLEYYFKNHLSIIRKNRTSIAVLKGDETVEELQLLADDIFRYFGLGCRNVTKLLLPKDMKVDGLFENFVKYQDVINHNKYANNYDYNRAVYLLNQDLFWDNNFVMLREDEKLFSPLSVVNFSRYETLDEAKQFVEDNREEIQAIVAKPELGLESIGFGETQNPSLDTYADDVDTMAFLSVI